MNEAPSSCYEIRVQGHLAPRRLDCFEGLTIRHLSNGDTSIIGTFRDQSALYGLLHHLSNLGVSLESINRQLPPDAEVALQSPTDGTQSP